MSISIDELGHIIRDGSRQHIDEDAALKRKEIAVRIRKGQRFYPSHNVETVRKRREAAERLRNGRSVEIENNCGVMEGSKEAQYSSETELKVDKGNPTLYEETWRKSMERVERKRREIAERLLNGGENIIGIVDNNGELKTSEDAQDSSRPDTKIAMGYPAIDIDEDVVEARRRKEIAERLRNGRSVEIENNCGVMEGSKEAQYSSETELKVDKDYPALDEEALQRRKVIAERLRCASVDIDCNGRIVLIGSNSDKTKAYANTPVSSAPKLKVDVDKLAAPSYQYGVDNLFFSDIP